MGDREKSIRVFSQSGRLFQVEYTFTAVKGPPHATAVGVASDQAVVVACQRKVPDKLIRAEDVTQTFTVTDGISAVIIGRPGDIKPKLYDIRRIAESYAYKFGAEIPIAFLAKKIADQSQVETQFTYVRLLGVTVLLFGIAEGDDGKKKPRLFKIDPSGVSMAHTGASVGQKDVEATTLLEKRHRHQALGEHDRQSALIAAVGALQSAVGQTFKSADVEVSIATPDEPIPRKLTAAEIDALLTDVAERLVQ